VHKVLTSPETCASTTLGNSKWQIEPSTQYLHVHFNESLNSYKHDWQVIVSKTVKRVVSHIIFTLYSQNIRLQHVQKSQMSTNWTRASWTNGRTESSCYGTHCWRFSASVYTRLRSYFVLEADISSIWCKDDVTYYTFEDIIIRPLSVQWQSMGVLFAVAVLGLPVWGGGSGVAMVLGRGPQNRNN